MLKQPQAAPTTREVARLAPGDHTVVIGGGPGGLTSAYVLAKDRHAVTVLEGTDVLGGISRTARYKGFRFDIGGHRFFTKFPPVDALWHEILGEEFISVSRLSRIYYGGKFFDYPLNAMNALKGLGLGQSLVIGASYLKANLFPSPIEENFEQWVSNRFGKKLYEVFFKTYTEKVWGIPCTEIRAEWAAQRIQGLSLAKAIINAVPLTKRDNSVKTLIHEFKYPRLGPGQMWETCADRVRSLGGQVLLKNQVVGLEHADARIQAVRVETDDGPVRLEGSHFISTMPLRDLIRAMDPPAPETVRRAAEGLRYRDFLVVALILDHRDVFPDNWIYIHSADVRVGRIQCFGNWSQALLGDPNKSCVGLEYFCFDGDRLWESSDEDLIELAATEIEQLGLANRALVQDGTVVRMRKAYPIYDRDYARHIEVIRRYLDPIVNLHPVGRNGMHKYNNQDHSMLTAMLSIENMKGADHDVWAVNTDYEYHEQIKIPKSRREHRTRPVAPAEASSRSNS